MLKIKDKVINNGLKGQIIDIKEADNIPGNPKPMFYACTLESLRKIAKEKGYALAIHGSCASDLDLIAVRWNDVYSKPDELVKCFLNELSNYAFGDVNFEDLTIPEHRYKNQIHYTIPIISDWYIDLTIIEDEVE